MKLLTITRYKTTHNNVLPKAGVTSFVWQFSAYQTLVFQINDSAKMPRLRQYLNRYRQGLRDLLLRVFWEGAWFGRGRIGDGFWERRRGRIICDAKVSDCFSGEVLRPSHRPRISATRIAFEVAPWPEKKPPLEGRYQENGNTVIFGSFVGKPCR